MKLWTTVGLGRLPEILKSGFDNPYSDEILFYEVPEIAAEQALEFEGELAFIETEIPDDQIDQWFTYCLGITGDELTDAEASLAWMEEGDASEEEKDALRKHVDRIRNVQDGRTSFNAFGFACLNEVIPPDMLKLLDPATMMEAVRTGDVEAVAQAVRETEPQAFKTLSAAFWVWLMTILEQILGPGYGAFEGEGPGEEAERIKEKARAYGVRAKKKRKKKATSRP